MTQTKPLDPEVPHALVRALPLCLNHLDMRSPDARRRLQTFNGMVFRPEAATKVAVDQVAAAMPPLTASFLAKELEGWRAMTVVPPNGGAEPLRNQRLFPFMKNPLRFTDRGIRAVFETVFSTPKRPLGSEAKPSEQDVLSAANGDLLLMLLLSEQGERGSAVDARSALSQLCWASPDAPLSAEDLFQRFKVVAGEGSDLAELWPWVADRVAHHWVTTRRAPPGGWGATPRDGEPGIPQDAFLRDACRALLRLARQEERRDKLTGMLAFFEAEMTLDGATFEAQEEQFDAWVARAGLKFSQREGLARQWSDWLEAGLILTAEYRAARAVHPLDREAPDLVFMERYEALDFGRHAEALYHRVNKLRSVIT